DRARALADEVRSAEEGDPLNSEYRMISRDGRVIWFHDQATLATDEKDVRPYMQGVMLDITDRKTAEAEMRDSQERLAAAQRLAAQGERERAKRSQRGH